MDSLPQETIDEIIDNLPHSSLRSSSLIAKRWRRRSQKRALDTIYFPSESKVKNWYTDTHNNPDGITSYAQAATFNGITEWSDPALFGRVLQNFSSLTTLGTYYMEMPDEMLGYMSHGRLGKNITNLYLWSPRCSVSTMISMIIAFPNLQNLVIDTLTTTSTEAPPAYSALPRRRPLDNLRVVKCVDGIAQTLANLRFTSRSLTLDVQTRNVRNFLTLSSVTIVELVLLDFPERSTSHLIDLPPFPALTSLKIYASERIPSPHLLDTLSSISSAPALASIVLQCLWRLLSEADRSYIWDRLDTWLARMARNTTVECGLTLTLTRCEENPVLKTLFPKFNEVGKIKTIDGRLALASNIR